MTAVLGPESGSLIPPGCSLGQLHRATPSCPAPSVWCKRDKSDGPARGSKRTFVRFLFAFNPSPAQLCADFGVKRTTRGRAGRLRVSSPGPPVGATGRAFFYPPLPPSGWTPLHSSLLFPSVPPPLPLQPCSSDARSPIPFPSAPPSYPTTATWFAHPPTGFGADPVGLELGRLWEVGPRHGLAGHLAGRPWQGRKATCRQWLLL